MFGSKKNVAPAEADKTAIDARVMKELFKERGDAVESWRVFKIMAEFVQGFEILRQHNLAATIFGSARCNAGDDVYDDATALAAKLSKAGFSIITGGGGGVMGAANQGAYKAGGPSVGLNIKLPHEQTLNPYTTEDEDFSYFFSRKVMLSFASEVYIYFPGGFGTLDEFFEIVTLIQTQKISKIPVVLYDKEFWNPLLDWMKTGLLKEYKTISPEDLDLFFVADTVDEAYEYIIANAATENTQQI